MSSAFSFGDADATMPLNAIQSAQTLAEIENEMRSDRVGQGKAFEDGSLFVRYDSFIIRVSPDGTFMGQRIMPDPVEIPKLSPIAF